MHTEKIKEYVGKSVKSYAEMCRILEEPEKTGGRNRNLQQEDWKRFIKFSKKGHKFYIEQVYDVPLPKKDDRRTGNHSIYVEDVENILGYMLIYEKSYEFTKNEWMLRMGMINKSFFRREVNEEGSESAASDYMPGSKKIRIHFKKEISGILSSIFRSCTGSLSKRGIICLSKQCYIIEEKTRQRRKASDAENEYIKEVEKRVLEKMGGRSKMQLIYDGQIDLFYKNENQILLKEKKWMGTYILYQISRGKNYDACKYQNVDIEESLLSLNYLITQRLKEYIDKKPEQAQKKYERECADYEKGIGKKAYLGGIIRPVYPHFLYDGIREYYIQSLHEIARYYTAFYPQDAHEIGTLKHINIYDMSFI